MPAAIAAALCEFGSYRAGLRHTAATLSLHAGRVPVRVISERLGHANVTVTLWTYAHALTGDDAAAADAIAEVLDDRL